MVALSSTPLRLVSVGSAQSFALGGCPDAGHDAASLSFVLGGAAMAVMPQGEAGAGKADRKQLGGWAQTALNGPQLLQIGRSVARSVALVVGLTAAGLTVLRFGRWPVYVVRRPT